MSRSRPKLDTSRIEYDDVVDSPAMKGMVSFLEVPPGQLPRLDFTTPGQSSIPVTGTPGLGIPFSGIPQGIPFNRIRRATLAQDGHSLGEQALYDALWKYGHPHGEETRIITVGYRRMSELARLTVNNCKANIQSLIEKLAVEEAAGFTHSQGRTYLIYNFASIIQRRREAGLTHYIKSRGVAFVNPETGQVLTMRVRDKSGIPFSGTPLTGAVPERGYRGAPDSYEAGIPQSATPSYSQNVRNSLSKTTSSSSTKELPPAQLVQSLRQIVDFLDDEAAAVLWQQCRIRVPDCTPEEILHFTRGKATIFRSGKIQNPTGFLLIAVPKCFEGSSFLEYRQEQARLQQMAIEQAKEAEEQMRQMRREFEEVLNNPNSSEDDRRFAQRMLEGN